MSEFQDYREVETVLKRYASLLDAKQYGALTEVFTPDAVVNYVGLGECIGVDSVIDLVSGVLDQCGTTQHLLGNIQVGIEGDRATASCYLQAIHLGLGDFAGQVYTVWGEYRDQLVKTGDGWRISRRELVTLHAEGDIGLK